jgi:poly(3-hydroxybutyrate) depolymerase
MTVEGELDDISGSGRTRAALDMQRRGQRQEEEHYEVKGVGHYAFAAGARWCTQPSSRPSF